MRITRVFFDVHMGKNFAGLLKICHRAQIKPEAEKDSYIVFMNGKCTRFKVLVGNKFLVYHDNKGKKVPLEAIQHLPLAFGGKQFEFDAAIRRSLQEKVRAT